MVERHPLDHITVADAARITGITSEGLRARIRRGQILITHVGSRVFVTWRDLEAFMRGNLIAPSAK